MERFPASGPGAADRTEEEGEVPGFESTGEAGSRAGKHREALVPGFGSTGFEPVMCTRTQ